jgi:uncharacterized protein (DUF488 family)
MGTIYTIGHGVQPLECVVGNLNLHHVDLVVDVRSHPVSGRAPQYCRETLAVALKCAGIDYAWVGRALGGRPSRHLRTPAGAPDYERMAAEPATVDALDQLAERSSSRRLALLCSESRPESCRRTRMLEPELERRGVVVEHILRDGSLAALPTLFS